MPPQQQQFDYDRGAQLAALRALSIPDGVARDGSGVTAGTALAVLRAIDDRIGSRPKKEPGRSQWTGETWVDQVTIGKQVGKSARTVAKAVQVLESMHLLNVLDTRRGGARRLVISIDWGTVFGDGAVYQDPTFLVEWGVLPAIGEEFTTETRRHGEDGRNYETNRGGTVKSGKHDLDGFHRCSEVSDAGSYSEVSRLPDRAVSVVPASVPPCLRGESNSEVSGFNSEVTSELIRKPLPNSLYRFSTKNTPTLSGVGGWEGIAEGSSGKGQGANDHGLGRTETAGRNRGLDVDREVRTDRRSVVSGVLCAGTKNEEPRTTNAGLSTLNPQPSTDPAMRRTIDPNEDRLTDRLVNLGVGSARATVQEALRIGYTAEAIDAVIDRYESSALVDPDRGETVYAWWPGSLVGRLRDVDARNARPECGKWGPKSAIWTALELRLKNGGLADSRGGSTNQLAKRREVIRGLNREQVVRILGAVGNGQWAVGDGIPERARKCLEWVLSAWKPEMVVPTPPQAVREFLALVDVEAILRGNR